MLATKVFKAIPNLVDFEPSIENYCRLKFAEVREKLSNDNVYKNIKPCTKQNIFVLIMYIDY